MQVKSLKQARTPNYWNQKVFITIFISDSLRQLLLPRVNQICLTYDGINFEDWARELAFPWLKPYQEDNKELWTEDDH